MSIEYELQSYGSQTSESKFSFRLKEHLTGDTEGRLDIFAQPAQQRIIVVWPDYRMLAAVGMWSPQLWVGGPVINVLSPLPGGQ